MIRDVSASAGEVGGNRNVPVRVNRPTFVMTIPKVQGQRAYNSEDGDTFGTLLQNSLVCDSRGCENDMRYAVDANAET